jgi:transposase
MAGDGSKPETIGIDLGRKPFTTLSDGTELEKPGYYREAQAGLKTAERQAAHRQEGSHRRRRKEEMTGSSHAVGRFE